MAETLSHPTALRKAQREVSEFRRFQELSQRLVEVNEAICRRRPVEEEGEKLPAAGEKQRMLAIMKSLKE